MTKIDASADALAQLQATVSRPHSAALTMPKAVYTDEGFLAREIEGVFKREWIAVGRAESLKNPGDYIATTVAGEPIAVLRDQSGALRGLSNVCRHRMSTMLEGRGAASRITCPYHGWVYNLDGRLRGAPHMEGSDAFERSKICLPSVRTAEWLGWIMVCLDPDTPPPGDRLSGFEAALTHLGVGAYEESFCEEFVWGTNWKVLAENFIESYHLPICHGDTIGGLSVIDEPEMIDGAPGYTFHKITKDPSFTLSVAHPANTRLQGEDRLTTVVGAAYPSLLITATPGYFWYLSLQPEGVDKVRVLYGGGLAPEFVADPNGPALLAEAKALLDAVNLEDKGCTERVFRGLNSMMGAPGPLSPMERPLYDFATYLAEKTR